MENCIEIKNVTREYPQFKLNNISFSVPCGTVKVGRKTVGEDI